MTSTFHKCILNVNAAPNPTPMSKFDKYEVKALKIEIGYISTSNSIGIPYWFSLLAIPYCTGHSLSKDIEYKNIGIGQKIV